MNVFGIGLPEMGLIMIVALLVFGPKKLPEIGSSLGKAMKASKEYETEFKKEAERIEKTVEPMKATLEKPKAIAPDKAEEPKEAEIVEAAEPASEVPSEVDSESASSEATEDAQTA